MKAINDFLIDGKPNKSKSILNLNSLVGYQPLAVKALLPLVTDQMVSPSSLSQVAFEIIVVPP